MIDRENAPRRKVPIRTIIIAIVMLAGIVLVGFGYFRNERVMLYLGAAAILSGVMIEVILGIIGGHGGAFRR